MGIWYKIKRKIGLVKTEGHLLTFDMRTYPENPESTKTYVVGFKVSPEEDVKIFSGTPFTKMMERDLTPIIERNVKTYIWTRVKDLDAGDIETCSFMIKCEFAQKFSTPIYRSRWASIIR